MSRFHLTAAVAICAAVGVIGCTLTWATETQVGGAHGRFVEENEDVPESIRALRATMDALYTKLPASGVDDPFHGGLTIALAVLAAIAASVAGSPGLGLREPWVRLTLNGSTLLLGAAAAITLWDCGHSVFDERAVRGTGIYVTLGALVLACLASAFAGTARSDKPNDDAEPVAPIT